MLNDKAKADLMIVFPKMEPKVDSILIPIEPTETFTDYLAINKELEGMLESVNGKATFTMQAVNDDRGCGIRIWRVN